MFTFLSDNKTKITGAVIVLIGFLQLTENAAALKLLMGEDVFSIWNIIIGGLVVVLGFLNTAAAEVRIEAKIKQGGFIRAAMLGLLLALSIPAMSLVQGCSGMQHAVKEAQTPDEKAFVLLKLYEGAQSEAARLIVIPSTPQNVVMGLQRLAPPAYAAANTLRPAADAYRATKSAASEAELSRAYDAAVVAINHFVSAVNQAKG